jgi:uncharacterized protein (AIM24 family)
MADVPAAPVRGAQDALDALITLDKAALERWCRVAKVEGTIAQTLDLELDQGQSLWCAKGSLLAYSPSVRWHLAIPGGAGKAVSRMMSGEGASLTRVSVSQDGARVVIAANQPGRLVTWDLRRGPIVCTAGAFVAALGDVDIDVTVARSVGGALFGGAGLFMQRLSGDGVVVIHGAGDFIAHALEPGESLLVSTGNLACFSESVGYGVKGVGGCLKSLLGGEGLFMTELKGPGWVMMQSLKKLPVPKGGKSR